MRRRLVIAALFLALTAAFSGLAWHLAAVESLARLAERGVADLNLATARLTNQLQRFREIAVLMADHPVASARLREGEDSAADAEAERLFLRVVDRAGAIELMLLDRDLMVRAASHDGRARLPATPELVRAGHGALGFHHRVDAATGRRIFSYAAPVFAAEGPVIGIVLLRFDAETVEAPGRGDPMPVWFTDDQRVVFVTNRSEMLFRQPLGAVPPDPAIYPGVQVQPFPQMQAQTRGAKQVWRVDGGPYLPARALLLGRDLPVIGMSGSALVDAGPALRFASLQAAVAAALMLGFGALALALAERRRALAARLASEARMNALLDARVIARTRELRATNERLTRAQAELVQAGKLSALGQMSAGISHELNQPLMAIRSYAENAALYLDRGRLPEAGDNLGRISEMARRMGRIIRNLRAFARQEREPMSDVNLVAVVEAALDLLRARLRDDGVAVDWAAPAGAVLVRGGEVRLQQVVVNLLSNAADAMAQSLRRRIRIAIEPLVGQAPDAAAMLRLSVCDTGPGIADPERIFDPFYSTKEVGSAEGMGLGLSISYGIVQSFGGRIAGRNLLGGGAEFTVDLVVAGAPGQGAGGAVVPAGVGEGEA
jgi:two-component system C4-dicarboxylate transport sensor histidine kinase DctB